MKNRGQITIGALAGIVGLVTAILAPAAYLFSRIGSVETQAAVIDSRTTTTEKSLEQINIKLDKTNDKLDALYLLDITNGKVFVLTKEGKYLKQIKSAIIKTV